MAQKREAGRQCFARFQRGKMTSTSDRATSLSIGETSWNIGNKHDVKPILFSVKETASKRQQRLLHECAFVNSISNRYDAIWIFVLILKSQSLTIAK
jgi:hypothetical protein